MKLKSGYKIEEDIMGRRRVATKVFAKGNF